MDLRCLVANNLGGSVNGVANKVPFSVIILLIAAKLVSRSRVSFNTCKAAEASLNDGLRRVRSLIPCLDDISPFLLLRLLNLAGAV